MYSIFFTNFKILKNKNLIKYNKIILTWCVKNNFALDGSINDKYLNINSKKTQNILWFVIYMDKELPSIIDKNIIIFQPINKKKINFFNIIKILFLNLKYLLTDIKYFLFRISSYNYFSNFFLDNFKSYINKDLKNILMLYEGQPFQNNLVNYVKKKKFNIKISGYVHSPPLALPANYVHKFNSPNKVFLNGKDQIYCFNKILGWNKKKLNLINSYRFLEKSIDMKSKIYLPFNIKSEIIILSSLKYLIQKYRIDFNSFKIKLHPLSKKQINITKIVKKIKFLIKESSHLKFNKSMQNFSVFIGASGAMIEALERGVKVIQIAESPILDIYSDFIWKSINIKKINNNIFFYSLKKKGNLIKFGKNTKNYLEFFK